MKREKQKTLPFAQSPEKLLEAAQQMASEQTVDRGWDVPGIHIGTSAFTAAGWEGSFYPAGMKPADYLRWDSFSGWSNRVRQISWRCRSCARLRYSSEGGYLRPAHGRLGHLGVMLRASWGNLPRPASWLPYMFTSIDDARLDEIIS